MPVPLAESIQQWGIVLVKEKSSHKKHQQRIQPPVYLGKPEARHTNDAHASLSLTCFFFCMFLDLKVKTMLMLTSYPRQTNGDTLICRLGRWGDQSRCRDYVSWRRSGSRRTLILGISAKVRLAHRPAGSAHARCRRARGKLGDINFRGLCSNSGSLSRL